jgi:hypothetical protein
MKHGAAGGQAAQVQEASKMGKLSLLNEKELTNVEMGAAAMSDATTAAELALMGAVSFAADKMRLTKAEVAIALKQNEGRVRSYFQYGLSRQIAEHLATMDEQIEAVYMYEDEATAEDAVLGDETSIMLHLIVRARRKTNALNALVAALDRALVQGYAGLGSKPNLATMLDVQVVDDNEVKNRTGYGALLFSPHHQPFPVWER